MSKRKWFLFGAAIAAAVYASASAQAPLATVSHVELPRYLGRWYEIARYPNRFEKQCDRDATATYALREDGRISVLNACTRHDGSRDEAKGWAKVSDQATNAKLKVTFFWPFFGDYWILDLGPNYEYAVVGEPQRKYLWILSREPHMSEPQYREITSKLDAKGYDPNKLMRVTQTAQ